jgi:peptidoglycan/LPS O-acetylase OafA/YrhL
VGGLLAAYVEALCFAVNILSINALSKGVEFVLSPFTKIIRWLGATTFALYMFHQPLLSFFTVYPVGLSYQARTSMEQALLLIGGTLLIVGTVGHICEKLKRPYKRFLLKAWARLKPARPAFAAVQTAEGAGGEN